VSTGFSIGFGSGKGENSLSQLFTCLNAALGVMLMLHLNHNLVFRLLFRNPTAKHSTRLYTLTFFWILGGVMYGFVYEGWSWITSLYFAFGCLTTGGFQVAQRGNTDLPPDLPALFIGLYCAIGIPLFNETMGRLAEVIQKRFNSKHNNLDKILWISFCLRRK